MLIRVLSFFFLLSLLASAETIENNFYKVDLPEEWTVSRNAQGLVTVEVSDKVIWTFTVARLQGGAEFYLQNLARRYDRFGDVGVLKDESDGPLGLVAFEVVPRGAADPFVKYCRWNQELIWIAGCTFPVEQRDNVITSARRFTGNMEFTGKQFEPLDMQRYIVEILKRHGVDVAEIERELDSRGTVETFETGSEGAEDSEAPEGEDPLPLTVEWAEPESGETSGESKSAGGDGAVEDAGSSEGAEVEGGENAESPENTETSEAIKSTADLNDILTVRTEMTSFRQDWEIYFPHIKPPLYEACRLYLEARYDASFAINNAERMGMPESLIESRVEAVDNRLANLVLELRREFRWAGETL